MPRPTVTALSLLATSPRPARSRFFSSGLFASGLTALVLAAGAGCASSPPPSAVAAKQAAAVSVPQVPGLVLVPAAISRTALVSSVTISHFAPSLAVATKLGSLVSPLPLDPNNLTAMAVQQLGLPPEAAAKVDLSKPVVGLALGNGPEKDASWILVVAARSPADAVALPALLGVIEEQAGPVARVKPAQAPAPIWTMPSGPSLLLASDRDVLGRGALLALEAAAQSTTAEDATVVVWPAAMAKEKNVDLRFALRMTVEQIANGMAEQGATLKAEQRAFLERMVENLADTQQVELGLRLDEARGMALQLRFVPNAGSKFELLTKDVHPALVDPSVLKGPTGLVVAYGDGSLYDDFYRAALGRLQAQAAKDKGAAAAVKLLDAMLAAKGPGGSAAGGFSPSLLGVYVMNLKDASTATAFSDALLGTTKEAVVAFAKDQDPLWAAVAPSMSVKKETVAGQKALHVTCSFKTAKASSPKMKQTLELLTTVYGDKTNFWMTVQGQKVVVAGGDTTAKEAFGKALAGGAAPQPSPVLQEALAAEAGHDMIYFLDLREILGLVGRFKNLGAEQKKLASLRGVFTSPLPVWGGLWGDKTGHALTLDLVFPRVFLENAGKAVPALAALFGGH